MLMLVLCHITKLMDVIFVFVFFFTVGKKFINCVDIRDHVISSEVWPSFHCAMDIKWEIVPTSWYAASFSLILRSSFLLSYSSSSSSRVRSLSLDTHSQVNTQVSSHLIQSNVDVLLKIQWDLAIKVHKGYASDPSGEVTMLGKHYFKYPLLLQK